MSSPGPVPVEAADGGPAVPAALPLRPRSAFAEVRSDLRAAGVTVAVLALTGAPAGLVWWLLAPRADFRITAGGPSPIGNPSPELLAADDVVFTLVMAGLGLLAGLAVWSWRSRRGLAALFSLSVGTAAAGALAWQLGGLLGRAPSSADLHRVGARVTTGLDLDSLPALAVGPFVAVLVYVVAAVLTGADDLGRRLPAGSGVGDPSVDRHGDGELLQRGGDGAQAPQQGELPA